MSSQEGLINPSFDLCRKLLVDRRYFWYLAVLAVLADAVLTQLVIRFIGFTEIDYETYMEQIAIYEKGVRDYTMIEGPTGPLVYPAGHVLIHRVLSAVTTSAGIINIKLAQQIYAALYIVTLLLTCKVYQQAGGMPNYAILPLILSKRLHSIFVLRLFNDCWAVAGMVASVAAYQKRSFVIGSVLLSLALSVKMNVLLYLPGLLVVLVQSVGVAKATVHLALIGAIQVAIAIPFLSTYPSAYVDNAFNFSRAFLYKWTVNWRFVPEDTFLSRPFATALTLGHLAVLVFFGLRWCQLDGGVFAVLRRSLTRLEAGSAMQTLSPDRITTILFTSNLIGIVFARSLHYQFYSWYAQQLPFLAWRTKYPVPVKILLLFGVEYAWNVYPSTNISSAVLLASNVLLLIGIWFGYPNGGVVLTKTTKKDQ